MTEDKLDDLPETYALALRLQAEGLGEAAIGRVLAIEPESVAPLLDLAHAKLAGLTGDRPEAPAANRPRRTDG
jgi:hypothetical protein